MINPQNQFIYLGRTQQRHRRHGQRHLLLNQFYLIIPAGTNHLIEVFFDIPFSAPIDTYFRVFGIQPGKIKERNATIQIVLDSK